MRSDRHNGSRILFDRNASVANDLHPLRSASRRRHFKLGGTTVLESEEVASDVVLDFDKEGRVRGVEVLSAKTRRAPGDWSKASAHVEAAE